MWRPSDAFTRPRYVPCERTESPPRDADTLRAEGFTEGEIAALERLDAHMEWTRDDREWGRVRLARYLVSTGRIKEDR